MEQMVIPANIIPAFRTQKALEKNVAGKLLFTTWGGIGDQICAEPTLRFAIDTFKSGKVYLESENPELYNHLTFEKVYNSKKVRSIKENFLVFETIPNPDTLTYQFVSHMVTHCVDFPALASLRCQLPIDYRAVILKPKVSPERQQELIQYTNPNYVAIHAGRHWPSKTFPIGWWNSMLKKIISLGFTPVLFGKDDPDQGTVATMTEGCIDLREKTTLEESIWLLQRMEFMVTNDSSPMHMAATGKAKIAFIASAKHHDYLYHWRRDENNQVTWAWNMKHFNKGGVWDTIDYCPNKESSVLVDQVDVEILKTWLPEPSEVTSWLMS